MKKSAYILIVAIIGITLLTSCSGNKRTYDYEWYGLNTPVKSVKVTTYEADSKFGEIVKGDLEWDGHYLAVFTSVGNLESISSFDDDGDLDMMEKYKYNNEDYLIEMSIYDDDGELDFQSTYEYDDNKITTITNKNYWSGEEEITILNHKWSNGYILETDVTTNGEFSSKTKYTKKGDRSTEWIIYDNNGHEISRGGELCNDAGRMIERNEGDIHMEVRWNDKNLPIYLKNAHLHNNTMIAWYGSGDDCVYYVEYEYDDNGNWIKQTVYEGELREPITISERVITY